MAKTTKQGIERLPFSPHSSYALDIEILSVMDLRKRVAEKRFRLAHQIDFFMLALITKGSCTHVIDYQPVQCRKGMLLLLQPGQAQQFDAKIDWDGWIVIFRAEFLALFSSDRLRNDALAEAVKNLPSNLKLEDSTFKVFDKTLELMRSDTKHSDATWTLNALLRFQLQSLLMRVFLESQTTVVGDNTGLASERFTQFRKLVEEKFKSIHQVSDYAEQMGCSVKSLTRSALDATGWTAKDYISTRINLEAKRLLTHTTLSVTAISEQLGFDESTNFTKFFKREVGQSPSEFREEHFSKYN
jgi:AraC-like DNA-binding protein